MKLTEGGRLRFRQAVSKALAMRFEQTGRCTAVDLLADVKATEPKLWPLVVEDLAQTTALAMIGAQMAKESPVIDTGQDELFDKAVPVRTIKYKDSIVDAKRASTGEYLWYARWFGSWVNGRVARTEKDIQKNVAVQRSARIAERFSGGDEAKPLVEVMKARSEKLEQLRAIRAKRKRLIR